VCRTGSHEATRIAQKRSFPGELGARVPCNSPGVHHDWFHSIEGRTPKLDAVLGAGMKTCRPSADDCWVAAGKLCSRIERIERETIWRICRET